MILSSDLIETVRNIAWEKPNYVYRINPNGCKYTRDTVGVGCGCIIGEAIIRLDWTRYDILAWYDRVVSKDIPAGILIIYDKLGIVGPKRDILWLSKVQDYQDRLFAWSQAVREADKYLKYSILYEK